MGPLRQRGHFMVAMLQRKLGFEEAGMRRKIDEPRRYENSCRVQAAKKAASYKPQAARRIQLKVESRKGIQTVFPFGL